MRCPSPRRRTFYLYTLDAQAAKRMSEPNERETPKPSPADML